MWSCFISPLLVCHCFSVLLLPSCAEVVWSLAFGFCHPAYAALFITIKGSSFNYSCLTVLLLNPDANISSLVSSVQRTLFQSSCGLFRCSFANPSFAAMLFSESEGFFLATLQYFMSLSYCAVMNFNLPTEGCRVLYVARLLKKKKKDFFNCTM